MLVELPYNEIAEAINEHARNFFAITELMALTLGGFGYYIVRSEKRRSEFEAEAKYLKEIAELAKALKESEEKFRKISASAQDAIIMMDSEGNISYWNESAEKIFGYSSQEVWGRELHILLAPQRYHEAYKKAMGKFKTEGKGPVVGKTLELVAVRKDGTEFPMELSLSAIKLSGRWSALGILRDITGRKCAEEALRESQEKMAGIVGSITDHMIMVDEQFNIIWANDVAKNLFGLNITGKKCHTVYYGSEVVCKSCIVKACFKDGKIHEVEKEVVGSDGSQTTFWCMASVAAWYEDGRPKMVVESLRDITERKRAVRQIETLKQEIEFILGATKTGLDIIDSEFNVRYIDPEWKKVCGDPTGSGV